MLIVREVSDRYLNGYQVIEVWYGTKIRFRFKNKALYYLNRVFCLYATLIHSDNQYLNI